MPNSTRFALLFHDFPNSGDPTVLSGGNPKPGPDHTHCRSAHFDLMLEKEESLITFRIEEEFLEPLLHRNARISVRALPNHRIQYLDYEGEISGNRGRVKRIDGGECQWLDSQTNRILVQLTGARLAGLLELTEIGGGWQAAIVVASESSQ